MSSLRQGLSRAGLTPHRNGRIWGSASVPWLPCRSCPPRHVGIWQQQSRTLFGIGEIAGVIANPAETLRQLNESKDMLVKAREDAKLASEKQRIPKKHTFAPLPGFHGRENEQELLHKILAGNPQLNVMYGATSVGKTALLRQVLASDDNFYVIKFDLRISGFGDLRSLYIALCQQFRSDRLPDLLQMNDKEMDKLAITFKHLILDVDGERNADQPPVEITVAHLADLMETLQSCLLRYWEYDPEAAARKEEEKNEAAQTRKGQAKSTPTSQAKQGHRQDESAETEEEKPTFKKRPIVFLLDEAHKLPALINDQLSLKVFLDAMLVLTKQDRLCHAILSTSDSFFQHFLRAMNVGHHAQLLTIGDCSKPEARQYFKDEILPNIPEHLRQKIDFEDVYNAFGGKLSHISDYVSAWVNKEGRDLKPLQSAIFTQAYTLLQFHMTNEEFETYSPLSTATAWAGKAGAGAKSAGEEGTGRFSREDLVHVMRKLVKPPYSLPYFSLCRAIGTSQADAMIKTRILDLRWTRTVTPELDRAEEVWSQDGIERPIVLPMTRIVRRAMEVVLEELDDEQSKNVSDRPPGKSSGVRPVPSNA
ncbi:uncharacterized protein B0I36DRAFT_408611 [Microdochium trichocladiopsis]|uniref:ATPase domain-containing protein n=1 Tax=Microdochium trichocladiopsis TaxID=1682393 RepID=A0A9P9BQ55_9PEZI|nr:uncharacterized protein B0I36DRAFT_408611 [Microdochium trichocladiopsis]KAH7030587.1 hypothetical protein B0I36DRAFT_408611 [Microdochium trichocladiopsis]